MSDPTSSNQYIPPPSNPYGPPPGSLPAVAPPRIDGVSIGAFVLGLLCCSPIALVLSIVGIVRTTGGQRKGRWASVAGLVLGVAGLIAGILAITAGGLFLNSIVEPGEAKVGQCVDIDDEDDSILMRKAECDEPHDAEIVGVAEVTNENVEQVNSLMVAYCLELISEEGYAKIDAIIDDAEELKALTEDPNDVEVGVDFACYVEPGDKLYEPIL